MVYAMPKLMTAEEFLLWREEREGTWELVDGVPQPKYEHGPEAMAGGRRAHAGIAGNIIAALLPKVRDKGCYVFPSDLAVRTKPDQVRQPDVTIDCEEGDNDDLEVKAPVVLFEVLSPSTRRIDHLQKGDEYRSLDSVQHFVLLEPNKASAVVWSRQGADWRRDNLEGLEAVIELTALNIQLMLSDVYAQIPLRS